MRLKMRIVTGIVLAMGMALSLSAKTKDATEGDASPAHKPGKLSHLMPFHKSSKHTEKESGGTLATEAKSEVRRHTNGFPEADKRGPEYQPQVANQQWADDNWKTARNKDTFKKVDSK
jgi:hypothetical protein